MNLTHSRRLLATVEQIYWFLLLSTRVLELDVAQCRLNIFLKYGLVGWLLEFYILATYRVISGWVPTCDSVHSWQLYIAALLGNQAADTMTRYSIQSQYPAIERISLCPILLLLSARLGSDW